MQRIEEQSQRTEQQTSELIDRVALLHAIVHPDASRISELLEPIDDIVAVGKGPEAKLMQAVFDADVDEVKRCLALPLIDVNAAVERNNCGIKTRRPPLFAVCNELHADDSVKIELASLLIAAGAKPDLSCAAHSDGNSALHFDCSAVLTAVLLEASQNVDVRNNNGETPLHLAAERNHTARLRQILDAKANRDAVDNDGDTPLIRAVKRGNIGSAFPLLLARADLSIRNKAGERAAQLSDFVKEYAGLVSRTETAETTAANWLAFAFRWHDYNVLRWRMEQKDFRANVLVTDAAKQYSRPPLMALLENPFEDVVQEELMELLWKAKARPDITDSNGDAALHKWCFSAKTLDRLKHLIPNLNLNVKDKQGDTPLHHRAKGGQGPDCTVLIDAKASVEAVNNRGFTPLLSAVAAGSNAVCDVLLEAKANPDVYNVDLETPLIIAARNGNVVLVTRLLKLKHRLNASDANGNTALLLAAEHGHTDTCTALISANANLNTQNNRGFTPLLSAVNAGKDSVCDVLLRAEALVDVPDQRDQTPLMMAASKGNLSLVTRFLTLRPRVNAVDIVGNSALLLAARNEHAKIVAFFWQTERTPQFATSQDKPRSRLLTQCARFSSSGTRTVPVVAHRWRRRLCPCRLLSPRQLSPRCQPQLHMQIWSFRKSSVMEASATFGGEFCAVEATNRSVIVL